MGASASWADEAAEPKKVTRETNAASRGTNSDGSTQDQNRARRAEEETLRLEMWQQIAMELVSQAHLNTKPHEASHCVTKEATVTFSVLPCFTLKTFGLQVLSSDDDCDRGSSASNSDESNVAKPFGLHCENIDATEPGTETSTISASENLCESGEKLAHETGTQMDKKTESTFEKPTNRASGEKKADLRKFWTLIGLGFDVSAVNGAFAELMTHVPKSVNVACLDSHLFPNGAHWVSHCVLESVVGSVESYPYPFDAVVQVTGALHSRADSMRRFHNRCVQETKCQEWLKTHSISRGHVRIADPVRWYPSSLCSEFGTEIAQGEPTPGDPEGHQTLNAKSQFDVPTVEKVFPPLGPFVAYTNSCRRCNYPLSKTDRPFLESGKGNEDAMKRCRRELPQKLLIFAKANSGSPPNVRQCAMDKKFFFDYLCASKCHDQSFQGCYVGKYPLEALLRICSLPLASLQNRIQFPDFDIPGIYPGLNTLWGKPLQPEQQEFHKTLLSGVLGYFKSHEFYLGLDDMTRYYCSHRSRMIALANDKLKSSFGNSSHLPGKKATKGEDTSKKVVEQETTSAVPELNSVGKVYADGQCDVQITGRTRSISTTTATGKPKTSGEPSHVGLPGKHTPIYAIPVWFCHTIREKQCGLYDGLDFLDFSTATLEIGISEEEESRYVETVLKNQVEAQNSVFGKTFVPHRRLFEVAEKMEREGRKMVPEGQVKYTLPEFRVTLNIKYLQVTEPNDG